MLDALHKKIYREIAFYCGGTCSKGVKSFDQVTVNFLHANGTHMNSMRDFFKAKCVMSVPHKGIHSDMTLI